ncbi:MAG: dephospho-CoA kinase [Bacillota bacterium]|nr:dephospho-CoA kinase [Bacillota bacterium]
MKVIGLTGGIGSGKSTVAALLKDLGAEVYDADKIAKDLVEEDKGILNELIDVFGNCIINSKGELDRKLLGDIVFSNEDKLLALNTIMHKHVGEKIKVIIEKCKSERKTPVLVIEAAIPIKRGFLDLVDEIWVITASKPVRIKRIIQRSSVTEEKANKIIESQISDDEYLKLADKIINNDRSFDELAISVKNCLSM